MATHPHSAATNGHGNSSTTKIEKLLAFHESAAAAIRMTIGLMNGHAKTAKTNGHASVLADALALDGARTAKTAKAAKRKKRGTLSKPNDRATVLAQRARTAKVLDAFSTKHPIPITDVAKDLDSDARRMGIAPLITHGYLKRKRGGLIRTAKAFVVNPFAAAAATE